LAEAPGGAGCTDDGSNRSSGPHCLRSRTGLGMEWSSRASPPQGLERERSMWHQGNQELIFTLPAASVLPLLEMDRLQGRITTA